MLSEREPPPSPPGDLASEIAQFTSLEACVKEHASTDPLVSDALGALGYDRFLEDACRTLEAAHARSPKPCARIDASNLRRECLGQLAMTTGAPDACPLRVDDVPSLGRDPTCLAVASGDARLCAGEGRERRPRCAALASRDEARCRGTGPQVMSCKRDLARWKGAIATPPRSETATTSSANVEISMGGVDAGPIEVDARALAERGVVLVAEPRGTFACQVGIVRESGAAPVAPSPEMGARLAFEVSVPAVGPATLHHLEVELPGRAVLVVPPLHWHGSVSFGGARGRGDLLTISLDGQIDASPHPYVIHLVLKTFIEDVISEG